MTAPLLEINNLVTTFHTTAGRVPAVDGVSLSIERGKTLGLVGESGCGKSVTAMSLMRLLPQPSGRILGGEVACGTKLNEADLAAELGISRGPIREAFRALEQSGLVRTEKNRGVFVRQVSIDEANEIYE